VVKDNESDVATHLEYALLLSSTGHDEEARALLTPYASGATVVPGALRALGIIDMQEGDLDSAARRFDALLSTGAQTYSRSFTWGDRRGARGHRAGAAQLHARDGRGFRACRAGTRGADQGGNPAPRRALHLEEFGVAPGSPGRVGRPACLRRE
jgi:hypothetical protein